MTPELRNVLLQSCKTQSALAGSMVVLLARAAGDDNPYAAEINELVDMLEHCIMEMKADVTSFNEAEGLT